MACFSPALGLKNLLLTSPVTPAVEAILFLAPLSFNQVLEEDPRVNRLVSVAVLPPPRPETR